MTWKSHKISTLAIIYAATGFIPGALVAMFASTLPDRLELRGAIKHRTVTHWFLPVLIVFSVIWRWYAVSHSLLALLLLFIAAGYIAHLFEDLMSKSGIPFVSPYEKTVGLSLYTTGKPTEYMALFILIALSAGISWYRGFFSLLHMQGQLDTIARLWTPL